MDIYISDPNTFLLYMPFFNNYKIHIFLNFKLLMYIVYKFILVIIIMYLDILYVVPSERPFVNDCSGFIAIH